LIASQFFSAVLTPASISALLAAMQAALAKREMMARPVAAYKFLAISTVY
jgi:chorismate mutase